MLCRVTLTALGIFHSHSLVFVKTKECETENYVFGSKIDTDASQFTIIKYADIAN